MRYIIPAILLVLSACSEVQEPSPLFGDAGPEQDALIDAEPRLDMRQNDSSAESDATISDDASAQDAGQTSDAGPPAVDEGLPLVDAGPDLLSDSGGAGCLPDSLEPDELAADAVLVASGTGWSATYPRTWHEGDTVDRLAADLDSTGVVALFRVHATDEDEASDVEVRVTCRGGTVVCRGSGAVQVGATCVARRRWNAFADVGCNTTTPASVTILVSSTRGASTLCAHAMTVRLSPATF